MNDPKIAASADLVEHYRQQMLEMYRTQPPSPPQPQEENNWLDERYPVPDLPRELADSASAPLEIPASDPEANFKEETPTINETSFIGYLRVYVFTGNGAEPLEGARVTVSRQEEGGAILYANVQTNRDGFTPVIPLPTVDPALTMRPGEAQPFVPYDIRILADGFRPVLHENIPVYGNNYVTLPVSLVPLIVGENPDSTQIFPSGGPADL